MKTVLILSKFFLPDTTVAANRASFTAGYLHQMGWKTIVITTDEGVNENSESEVLRSILPPEKYIHRIKYKTSFAASWFGSLLRLRWDLLGKPEFLGANDLLWKKLMPILDEIVDKHAPDIIYCTSPPPIMAYVAYHLSTRYNIPYVIDMRDIPQQFLKMDGLLVSRRYRLHCKRLAKPIAAAAKVITVSDGLRDTIYKHYGCDSVLIYNGFDHLIHEFAALKRTEYRNFTITYTGSLSLSGIKDRSPEPLFMAIDFLLKEYGDNRIPWKIKFIGVSQQELKSFQHYKSFSMCEFINRVPYDESLVYQHSSTILLHLTHNSQKGIMTSKIFDYLAANRPILTVPGDNDCVDDLLKITKSGVSLSDPKEIAEQLMAWYLQWMTTGEVMVNRDKTEIDKYSRQNQTRKLSELMELVLSADNKHQATP